MFVEEVIQIQAPMAVVLNRLAPYLKRDGLQSAGADAFADGQDVLRRAGVAGVGKQVRVHNVPAYPRGDTMVIPMRWVATGPAGDLFPAMDANLDVDPGEDGGTSITFRGAYRPPLGTFGVVVDKVLLSHVAQATARCLLSELGRVALASGGATGPAAGVRTIAGLTDPAPRGRSRGRGVNGRRRG